MNIELINVILTNFSNYATIISIIGAVIVFCYRAYYNYSFKKYYGISNEYSDLPLSETLKKIIKLIFMLLLILLNYSIKEYMEMVSYNAYQLFISFTFIEYFFLSIHIYFAVINISKYNKKVFDYFLFLLIISWLLSAIISYLYYVNNMFNLIYIFLLIYLVSTFTCVYCNFGKIVQYDIFKYKNCEYAVIGMSKENIVAIKTKRDNKKTFFCYGEIIIIKPQSIELKTVTYKNPIICRKF